MKLVEEVEKQDNSPPFFYKESRERDPNGKAQYPRQKQGIRSQKSES